MSTLPELLRSVLLVVSEQAATIPVLECIQSGDCSLYVTAGAKAALEVASRIKPDLIILGRELSPEDRSQIREELIDLGVRAAVLALPSVSTSLTTDDCLADRVLLGQQYSASVSSGLRSGELLVDPTRGQAWYGNTGLMLTPTELRILCYFLRNAGRVICREELAARVWGHSPEMRTDTYKVTLSSLRRKLRDVAGSNLVCTVRGKGYVLNLTPPATESSEEIPAPQ